ncbi:d2.1 [Ichnoviriform fugitivi]|uniref:D2.1 n=1 Tax=Ichnoviriform fugitivi TaxID=265522 RepID=A2Q0J3_9VIRU|nr:d2.1 [Ichnoviriform fugitivi]BAF45708.1 d2.1 [Ichnoviriform fugitivi]
MKEMKLNILNTTIYLNLRNTINHLPTLTLIGFSCTRAGTTDVARRVQQHFCVRTFTHGIIFHDVRIVLVDFCNNGTEHLFGFFKKNRRYQVFSQPRRNVPGTEMMPVAFVLALTSR